MAPLTWRNVDAPNFSGTAQSLAAASSLLDNATGGIQKALDRRRLNARDATSSAIMLDALQYTNPEAFRSALPGLVDGYNPSEVSPDAVRFLAGREQEFLANENTRLKNTGQGIYNDTSQFNLDSSRAEEARKAGYRANQPDANQAMVDARILASSADPVQRARGQQMLSENSKLFSSAGINGDTQLNNVNADTAAYNEGMRTNQNTAANADFFRDRYREQGQRGLLDSIVQTAIDGPQALEMLRATPGIDAKTLENLTKDITEKADTYFPKPSVLSSIGSRGATPSSIMNDYVNNTPRATRNAEQSGVPYVGYDNQNAKRNDPISNRLIKAMDFLPAMGIEMRVTSGGQEDNKENGTGSPRHNHGEAGDVFFYRNGKKLDWNNPADQPIFQEITRQGLERGITGFGAGKGYMSPGSMHLGFGSEAVWGKNGDGANAAPWLKGTYDRWVADGRPRTAGGDYSPSAMMQESVVRNGGVSDTTGVPVARAPVDAVAQNILSNTVGNPYDARTVVATTTPPLSDNTAAAPLSETTTNRQDDLSKFKSSTEDGRKVYTDDNGQKFVPAGDGQYTAVDDRGVPTGLDSYVPAGLVRAPVTTDNTAANTARQGLSATQLINDAQTAANTAVIDNLSNPLTSAEQELSARPNRGENVSQVVTRLRGTKEAPGILTSVPEEALTAAINQIMQQQGVDADVAGILAANSRESRDLGFSPLANTLGLGIPNWLFAGDEFGGATNGRMGPRIDTNRAGEILGNFRTRNNTQPGAVSPGVSRLNTAQRQEQAQQQVQAVAQQVVAVQDRVDRLRVAVQRNPSPELVQQLEQAEAYLQMLSAQLNGINQSGNLNSYTPNSLAQ